MNAHCEECRKKGAKLAYKLNPRNWHRELKLLCRNCRVKLGYAPVEYERPRQKAVVFGGSP